MPYTYIPSQMIFVVSLSFLIFFICIHTYSILYIQCVYWMQVQNKSLIAATNPYLLARLCDESALQYLVYENKLLWEFWKTVLFLVFFYKTGSKHIVILSWLT